MPYSNPKIKDKLDDWQKYRPKSKTYYAVYCYDCEQPSVTSSVADPCPWYKSMNRKVGEKTTEAEK